MKTRKASTPWLALWMAIIVVTVAIGIATRLSYTDISRDQSIIDNMIYAVAPYTKGELGRIAEGFEGVEPHELEKEADLIVIASKDGCRKYLHKAFLTSLEVKDVIKGEELLDGNRINVFEPVGIYEWPSGRTLVPSGAYVLGGMLIRDNTEYVLFLKRAPKTSGVAGYTIVNSPHAKIPVDKNFPFFLAESVEYDTRFEQYASYDIVIGDQDSLDRFRSAQSETLRYISNSGVRLSD